MFQLFLHRLFLALTCSGVRALTLYVKFYLDHIIIGQNNRIALHFLCFRLMIFFIYFAHVHTSHAHTHTRTHETHARARKAHTHETHTHTYTHATHTRTHETFTHAHKHETHARTNTHRTHNSMIQHKLSSPVARCSRHTPCQLA